MKKVFLLSLGLILGLSAFAQRQVIKNDLNQKVVDSKVVAVGTETTTEASTYAPQEAKSVVVRRYDDMEDGETMWTYYDLQSNGWCSNRMYQVPNGGVGIVATMSLQANTSATDRGTGYNFYDGSDWGDQPEERVEPARTGWPTIARYGATGEVLISHAPTHCYIREVAGEGEWQDKGALPDHPEGYPYDEDLAWPRVATSGENCDIIHVIADIQHAFPNPSTPSTNDSIWHHQVYYRSLDGGQTWEAGYSPLAQDGLEGPHGFTADNYVIAANGHNVAVLYSDDLQNDVVMYKSTDDGATWTQTIIWENPYKGCDWEHDECSIYTDTMYGPSNTAMVIDNNGVVHVAMNTYEYIHSELGTTYTVYSGRAVDGIYYWNDTREAPIQSTDGNPHHALRLWWPSGDGMVQMEPDSTKWIGFIPFEAGDEWNNDFFYHENDYFYKTRGASAMPALSCDPDGNLACAFSTPDVKRTDGNHYFRSVYVSYYDAAAGYWIQDEDNLMEDIIFMVQEGIFTISANNTANVGEFWFGYQADDVIGFKWGSDATQAIFTENIIHGVKIVKQLGVEETEAQDVVYNIYPNPAKDYIVVSSSMDANATITFVNLAGQTVKSFNKNLTTGENSINIDLESGAYFCTISANGFDKTVKVIVK